MRWLVSLLVGLLPSLGCAATFVGQVVDEAGRPVAGVTVFNAGDGPERVEGTTDEQGRFRLDGLLEQAYVFVDSPEHRFAGVRASAGAPDLRIVLRERKPVTLGDPPPPRQPVLPPEEARELAGQLLIESLQQTAGSEIVERRALIRELAAIDDEAAVVAAAEGREGPAIGEVEAGLAQLSEDFDEGLDRILQADDPRRAFWGLHRVASRHRDDDPDFALQCLEAAEPIWPEIPGPDAYRLVAAARLGGLLYEIDRERGEKFLKEIYDLFMPVGLAADELMGRGALAREYSVVDLDASLELLAPMAGDRLAEYAYGDIARKWATIDADKAIEIARLTGDSTRAGVIGRVAVRIAPTDPEKALAFVKQDITGAYRWRPLVDVITALGPEHLDLALAEARSMAGGPAPYAARALGRLAYIAPADQAPGLIEEALEALVNRAPAGWAPAGAEDVGRLAFVAKSLAYPEWREIALRAASRRAGVRKRMNYGLAYVLSFCDPELARHVLESAMALDGGMEGVVPGAYRMLAAAAMQIDPRWAAELIGQMVPDDVSKTHGPRTDAVHAVVRCLLRSPEAWEAEMLSGSGVGYWGRPRSAM